MPVASIRLEAQASAAPWPVPGARRAEAPVMRRSAYPRPLRLNATSRLSPQSSHFRRAKPARDIASSRWSVGGETLDRGFGVHADYKAYLGPLGAKSIRLQAGWARCEPQPGVYEWGWLDAIVDDALGRMLAHHAKDVPFSLFTMIDLRYRRGGTVDMNYKGLLASREDQTVDHVKPAYETAQRVFAIFDDALERVAGFACTADTTRSLAASAYVNKQTGAQVVALWFSDEKPSDSNARTLVDLTFAGVRFDEPVLVDLLTGEVRALPGTPRGSRFSQIPLYDSPILIAERSGGGTVDRCDGGATLLHSDAKGDFHAADP